VRVRATAPQTGLSAAARRRNLRDAFALTRPLGERSVAILDDVMTTGGTLDAIAGVLRRGGAEYIEVWVCARTVPRA